MIRKFHTVVFDNDSVEAWAWVRTYVEKSHYEGDAEMTDWYDLVEESRVMPDEFAEFIKTGNITGFQDNDEMAMMVKMFPKPKD